MILLIWYYVYVNSVIVILDNIRSTHNVGSILRTADGFGAEQVFFAGYTPYPTQPDDTRLPHESRKITSAIHKTALGAEETLNISLFDNTANAIETAKNLGFVVAAIEQSQNSIKIQNYSPPDKIAVVLGNEVSGISSDTLALCDVILEVPMFGQKESFNVSVAAAISLYALMIERSK